MAQIRLESNSVRPVPGGSSLTIVRRRPAPFVECRTPVGMARWAALLDEQDEDHDGWQPIRLRLRERLRNLQMGAAKRLGMD